MNAVNFFLGAIVLIVFGFIWSHDKLPKQEAQPRYRCYAEYCTEGG